MTSHIYEVANAISRTTPIRPSRFLEDKKWPPHDFITTDHFRINNIAQKDHFRPNNVTIQQQSNSLWTPKLRSFNDDLHPPIAPSPAFKLSHSSSEPDGLVVQRPSTEVSRLISKLKLIYVKFGMI